MANDKSAARSTEPATAAVTPPVATVQQQQQAEPNTVGTTPAATVQLAPAPQALVRFERVTGTGAKLPYARCALIADGCLAGAEIEGFCIWKDGKTGEFNLTMPGMRFPLIRPTAVRAVTVDGDETLAVSPKGVKLLKTLDTGIYGAFLIWEKRPEAFPGGLVPVTLA